MPEIGVLAQVEQGHVRGVLHQVEQGNIRMINISNATAVPVDSVPGGGAPGDLLAKRSYADRDMEWITPANSAEQDNTRPITAAAVYTEIGNINALLATI